MKRAKAKARIADRKAYMARLREAGVGAPVLISPANKTRRNSKLMEYRRRITAEEQSAPIRDARRRLMV